jgi:hypothetical protein
MLRIEVKSYKLDYSKNGECITTFQLMSMFQRHYILYLLYCKASNPESCVCEGQKLNLTWTTKGQSIGMKFKFQKVTFKTEIILFCRETVAVHLLRRLVVLIHRLV